MSKNKQHLSVGRFKPVKYYEAKIEGSDEYLQIFAEIGRKVITEDQYRNIGFNYVLEQAIKKYNK